MMRYTAYKKYIYYLLKFSTQKKLSNILLNRSESKKKQTVLRSFPYKITFDPSNLCNLRCTGCHTGIKHPEMIKPTTMSFKNFKIMFDKVKENTISIALYNWGEPFLNNEIFDIIAYAEENKVGTTLHTNLNYFDEIMAKELVRSKLTHLYLSIDGASQEVYTKYRIKGSYDKVIENLKTLVSIKKNTRSKFPFITWKYLEFPFNSEDIDAAKNKAEELGADNFEVFTANKKLMDIYDEASNYMENPAALKTLAPVCKSLWNSIYVGPTGVVFPCSLSFRESETFGNLLEQDLSDFWNNEKYQGARSMFSQNPVKENIPLPCRGCKYYLKCIIYRL